MKKFLSILVFLCIFTTVFAAGSIRAGAAFSLVSGRTKPFIEGEQDTLVRYNSMGFGFDVLGKDDFSDNVAAWFDFNMFVGLDGKFKLPQDSNWKSINDLYKEAEDYAKHVGGKAGKKLYSLSVASGLMYKLPLTNTHFSYAVGGGIFIDRLFAEVSVKDIPGDHSNIRRVRSFNLGLTTYGEISKKYSDHFGISLTVMLRIGLLNFSTDATINDGIINEQKAFGFAPSFSMPVVLGVTYFF